MTTADASTPRSSASAAGAESDFAAHWYRVEGEHVARELGVDPVSGLSAEAVRERQAIHGPNRLEERRRRSVVSMFLAQFTDFMVVVLIVAAGISGFIGDMKDTIAILVIVIVNALIGATQEYRAERAIAALKSLATPSARVRRDGDVVEVKSEALVPGDVVLLEAGGVVPADLRLVQVVDLRVDESALTGESRAVSKATEVIAQDNLPIGDRTNLAFKGTQVARGRGSGIVVGVGMRTELGRVATLLQEQRADKTPLQQRLARFGRVLSIAILAICAVIFLTGIARGEPLMLMLLTAVSLAVAGIPEGLPAVVSVSLALGARRMSHRQALVRHLPAVETLGSVTVICSDKTGTLTEGRMRVGALVAHGGRLDRLPGDRAGLEPWSRLGEAMALSNDVHVDSSGHQIGDPTEVALCQAAMEAGFDKTALASDFPLAAELPFDASRRRMTTVHRMAPGTIAFVKGAPEQVIPRCRSVLSRDGALPLQPAAWLEQAEALSGEGFRVLAFATRRFVVEPEAVDLTIVEEELELLALVGLLDPPREQAPRAVADCAAAGITPVMITGDHPATAQAIAKRVGIDTDGRRTLTGQDLGAASPDSLDDMVARVRVYARVSPEQKIDIVNALQGRGHFVAMTGDGVNDAPALRRADIGVAMGQKGTDVAREAADMVLLDDNFATIVAAVREGRRIFDNIRKFVKYTMTSNAGEIWTLFLAPFLGLPLPLIPIQILWINLVTDGLPGLALAVEPEEQALMQRPPRPPRESLFAHGNWQHMIWVGLLIGALSLAAQAYTYHAGEAEWQTVVFTVLTFCQLVHVLVIRSERESLFTQGLSSNRALLGAVALTVALQLAVIYVPALQGVFKTQALTPSQLALCFALPAVVFVAVEIEKWLVRRAWIYATPR